MLINFSRWTGADKCPVLGLVFQALYHISLCHRIPAPYCFCISSLANGTRNWNGTIELSPSCSCSPHLCNRMNHFNTKLCFLPNKQDYILPWQRGLMQSALRNPRVQCKTNFSTLTSFLPHLLGLISGLSALNYKEKKGWWWEGFSLL